jgi:hypothetical protein
MEKEKHENKLRRKMEKIKMSDKIENALILTLFLLPPTPGNRKTFQCNIASV